MAILFHDFIEFVHCDKSALNPIHFYNNPWFEFIKTWSSTDTLNLYQK